MKNLNEVLKKYCICLNNKRDFIRFCTLFNSNLSTCPYNYELKSSIKDVAFFCNPLKYIDVDEFTYPLYVKQFDDTSLIMTIYLSSLDKPISMFEYFERVNKKHDEKTKRVVINTKNISHVEYFDYLNRLNIKMSNGDFFEVKPNTEREYINLVHDIEFCNTIEI